MRQYALLCAVLLTSACTGGPAPVDGQKFVQEQDGPHVPTVKDTLVESAKTAEKKGDFAQAAQFYQQAIDKGSSDEELLLSWAEALRRSGNVDSAIRVYDTLLTHSPAPIAAKEGKALTLLAKQEFDNASMLLAEVMKTDSSRWKTLNALGIIDATKGQYPNAEKSFTNALQYYPDSPTILNNLGLTQALSHLYPEAITSLTKASGLSAADSADRKRIDLNTALVYALSGKLEDARQLASLYLSDAALSNNMGLYAHLANDDAMAKSYLNMALTQSKVYYEKAWGNLQAINDNSGATKTKRAK